MQKLKHESAVILTKLMDLSFETGVVPSKLKIAKVLPLLKDGDKKEVSNYRPVSVLPVLSKIVEICVNQRLQVFLNSNNLLSKSQYGFCRDRDTETAVIDLISDIQLKIDSGQICALVSLDLQKAFDTVDHGILLVKLEQAGVRGMPLLWFRSYLANRRQMVSINGVESSLRDVKCGVPQGSVLGPTLFLMYVNSICKLNLGGSVKLYADDTTIVYCGKDPNFIRADIARDLGIVNDWLMSHKLTLNIKKSSYMLLSKRNLNNNQNIMFGTQSLMNTCAVKYLGLIMDSTLSWANHIERVRRKIAPFIGVLYRVGYLLGLAIRKKLYYAHIYSHLHYLISVWGTAGRSLLKPLQTLQNRAIKNIYRLPMRFPTHQLYCSKKMFNLENIYIFKILLSTHYIVMKNKRSLIQFVNVSEVHNHQTRQRHNLYLPKIKSNTGQKSIFHDGVKLYNRLPQYLKSIPSKISFRKRLKQYIMLTCIESGTLNKPKIC